MDPEEDNNGSSVKHIRETIISKKVGVSDTEFLNVGISSQIIDYYNRFGHNRDLEKYLALTSSPIRLNVDSNAFKPVGSRTFSHATAPEQMEVCRLAVNCSLEDSCSSLKETSYVLDDILESEEDSVEVDDEKNTETVQVDSDSCKNPHSDLDSPRKSAELNLDTSLNKPPSPSSSVTSRRLEWDSLADVGYSNNGGRTLSTLERMALHQQYANSGELQRAEDREIGLPTAQSTPINLNFPSTSVQGKSKTSNKNDIRLKKNMKKSVKIKQPVVKETIEEHLIGDYLPKTINVNLTRNVSVNFDKMDNIKDINLLEEDNKTNTTVQQTIQSRNISTNTSILTNLDKEIQTTLTKETTKSGQNFNNSIQNEIRIISEKPANIKYVPIMLKLGKKPQNISVGTRNLKRKNFKQKYKKATKSLTLFKSDDSKVIHDAIEMNNKPSTSQHIRNHENELSEAESFEYLPGHMYQRKDNSNKESPEKPTVSTSRTTSLESSVGVTSSSQGTDQQDSERSFSKDLRASIALLNKLVEERHKDASLKRRLIKSVIKKLLKTKYRDDTSTPDEHSPNIAENSESERKNDVSNDENRGTSTSARNTSEENELLPERKSNLKKSILRKRDFDFKSNASPAHSAPDLAMPSDLHNTKEIARSSLSLELEKLLIQSTYQSNASSKTSSEVKRHSSSIRRSSDNKTSPDWLKPVTKSEKLYERKVKEKHFEQKIDSISKSTQSALVVGDDKSCWVPYDTVLYENKKPENVDVVTNLVKELSRLPKEIGSGDSRLDSSKSPVGIGNAPRRMHTVFTLAGLNYHNKKTEVASSSGHKKNRESVSTVGETIPRNRQKVDKEDGRESGGSPGEENDLHYCCCPDDETSNIKNPSQYPENIMRCDCRKLGKCVLEDPMPGEFKRAEVLSHPKRPLHICDAEGKIIANFNDDFIIYKRVTEPQTSDRSHKKKSDGIPTEMIRSHKSLIKADHAFKKKNERSNLILESDLESEKVKFDYPIKISEIYNLKSENSSEHGSIFPEWDSHSKIHKEKNTQKTGKSDNDSIAARMESPKEVSVSIHSKHLEQSSSKLGTRDRGIKRDDSNITRNERGDDFRNDRKNVENSKGNNKRENDSHNDREDDTNVEKNDEGIRSENCDQCSMDTKEIQTRLSINTKALKPTLQDINIDDYGPPCICIGSTCCALTTVSPQKLKQQKNYCENRISDDNSKSHSSSLSEPKIVPQLKKIPVIGAQGKNSLNSKASTQNADKYDNVIPTYRNSLSADDKSPNRKAPCEKHEKNVSNENSFSKYDENMYQTKLSVKKTDVGSPRTEMLKSRNDIIADVCTMRNHLHKMAEHKWDYSRHRNLCEKCVPETCSSECNLLTCHSKPKKFDCGENTRSIPKSDKSVSTKSDKSSCSIYSPVRSDRRREQTEIHSKYNERHPKEVERNCIHSGKNSKHIDNRSSPRSKYNVKVSNQKDKFIEPRTKSRNSEKGYHSALQRTSGSKSGVDYTLSSTSSMTIDSRSVRRPGFSDHNSNGEVRGEIANHKYIILKSPKKVDKNTFTTKIDYTKTTQNIATQSVDVDSNLREQHGANHSQNKPYVSRESKKIGTCEHYTISAKSEKATEMSCHDGDNQVLSVSSSLSYTDSLKNLIEMFKENEKKLECGQSNKITPRDKQNDILRQLKFLLSATTVNVETDTKKVLSQKSKPVNTNSLNMDSQTTSKNNPRNVANEYKMYETGRCRMYHVHQGGVRKDSTAATSEQIESPMTTHAQKLFHKFKKAYDKLYSQHAHCCHECCKIMQQMHSKGDSCEAQPPAQPRSKSCGKCGTRYAKIYHDTDSSTPVCCSHKCLNRRPVRRTDNKPKVVKRSLAYNLILEPSSHSINENVSSKKKTPLKDVFMKIPKSDFVNYNQTTEKEKRRCLSNENLQASEDHIFPGNLYSYHTTSRNAFVPNERSSSAPESSSSEPVCNTMSLREYLHRNRPDFVTNADKRQDTMKALQGLRLQHDAAKRLLVSLGAATRCDARHLSLTDVRDVARHAGLAMPHNFADLEKPIREKEMKQHSQKIFKQLPEQLQKKEKKKKEMVKQTNRLMASLYRKSLQKKALGGTVTMSHYTSIVSL